MSTEKSLLTPLPTTSRLNEFTIFLVFNFLRWKLARLKLSWTIVALLIYEVVFLISNVLKTSAEGKSIRENGKKYEWTNRVRGLMSTSTSFLQKLVEGEKKSRKYIESRRAKLNYRDDILRTTSWRGKANGKWNEKVCLQIRTDSLSQQFNSLFWLYNSVGISVLKCKGWHELVCCW